MCVMCVMFVVYPQELMSLDFQEVNPGDPMFMGFNGEIDEAFKSTERFVPIFVNEVCLLVDIVFMDMSL